MKKHIFLPALIILVITLTNLLYSAEKQDSLNISANDRDLPDISVTDIPRDPLVRKNLGGPRLGMSMLMGESALSRKFDSENMNNFISQFGWHFEYLVSPKTGGPSFVVEFIPLVAGVEYGKFIPSVSFMLGIRFENGFEFGMGPNLMLGGSDLNNYKDINYNTNNYDYYFESNNGSPLSTALVLAVGKTFSYGEVNLPFNLAYTISPVGDRLS